MTARLEPIDPQNLIGSAADLYSRYASGERAKLGTDFTLIDPHGQLTGPPATWMLNPDLGLRLEQLGYGVRFELKLPARHREIVILMVAAHEDSAFERYAHHQAARRAGLDDDEVSLLDTGAFTGVDNDEKLLVATAESLLTRGGLSSSEWNAALSGLGRSAILEIVTLIGWYRMMAMQLRVFGIEPPK